MTRNQDMFHTALGFERLFDTINRAGSDNFPPYNIISIGDPKSPEEYVIELAVAGFSKEDLDIRVRDQNGVECLIIEGKHADGEREISMALPSKDAPKINYAHKGIATRAFRREFSLSRLKVNSVGLEHGILTITLKPLVVEKRETRLTIS